MLHFLPNRGRSLAQVSPTVIPLFAEIATQLIEEKGPEEALAAALAIISGVTELKTRSLLSSIPVSTFTGSSYSQYSAVHWN